MLAHRQANVIPRLSGRGNYKEWSHKVELHMRIQEMWPAVIAPPVPIKTEVEREDYIFVASRKRIYIQCPDSLNRKVKLFLLRFIEPMIIMPGYPEMSVPYIWHELKRQYGHLDESKRKLNAKLLKKSKKIKLAKEKENSFGIDP
ncbi:uncharacterized protein LOC135433510 [Drosophila montana]|uniref:uncharacterized protein LOC135433510 n=1 Tax=Drosophila montana TaxID=40370 RepID=UPI00313EAB9A